MKRRAILTAALSLALVAFLSLIPKIMSAETPRPAGSTNEVITLGGGCFWCLEAVYQMVDGVKSVTSGYAGGQVDHPTYKQVCGGDTGHAEVVQIAFDPAKVSLDRLLELFWQCHDPTSLNRQGADTGTQYRSVIFFQNDAQRLVAEKSKATAQKEFTRPIVTEIVALPKFYAAEAYHQNYFRNNPTQGYCQAVIAPKVQKIKKKIGLHE